MNRTAMFLLCALAAARPCAAQQVEQPSPEAHTSRIAALEEDLVLLDEQIHEARDTVIEHTRLHDLHRIRIRAEVELQTLEFVIREKAKAQQELLLLEAKHAFLTDTNAPASGPDAGALRRQQASLKRTIKVLDEAEYKWQAKTLLASRREPKLRHLQAHVERLERTYAGVADQLHELRMRDQLKSLQNGIGTPHR